MIYLRLLQRNQSARPRRRSEKNLLKRLIKLIASAVRIDRELGRLLIELLSSLKVWESKRRRSRFGCVLARRFGMLEVWMNPLIILWVPDFADDARLFISFAQDNEVALTREAWLTKFPPNEIRHLSFAAVRKNFWICISVCDTIGSRSALHTRRRWANRLFISKVEGAHLNGKFDFWMQFPRWIEFSAFWRGHSSKFVYRSLDDPLGTRFSVETMPEDSQRRNDFTAKRQMKRPKSRRWFMVSELNWRPRLMASHSTGAQEVCLIKIITLIIIWNDRRSPPARRIN